MYLNRITFSLNEAAYKTDEILKFNRIASYFEELLFHHLSKKVNVGGYGFFHNKFTTDGPDGDIESGGQIVIFTHVLEQRELPYFLDQKLATQIEFLCEKLKASIDQIAKAHPVDTEKFHLALAAAAKHYAGFEQKMKVSKQHPSRNFSIDIVRVVDVEGENIVCRILSKKKETISEFVLKSKSSIYDVSYDYRKSKWAGNELKIFNRFAQTHLSIDSSKYIS